MSSYQSLCQKCNRQYTSTFMDMGWCSMCWSVFIAEHEDHDE